MRAALAQGAAACLVEREGVEAFGFDGDAIAAYAQLKAATGPIAAAYFEQPERAARRAGRHRHQRQDLHRLVAGAGAVAAWRAAGPAALIGTLGIGRPPHVEFNGLTTPDPVLLQRQFRRFVDAGLEACAIEASSIGIVERRLDGTRIRVAVFTNFTQDHLDYHGTMEAYWQAKAELFRWPGLRAAVVNIDDGRAPSWSAVAAGRRRSTCGRSRCGAPARLQALRHRLRRRRACASRWPKAASGTRWRRA